MKNSHASCSFLHGRQLAYNYCPCSQKGSVAFVEELEEQVPASTVFVSRILLWILDIMSDNAYVRPCFNVGRLERNKIYLHFKS